ncbi:hypothetical protein [Metapseudomonas resinovorans]|uniref:Uncharacterized protein n=1 Tax=Metapseudomonas resinovorans NBRC 106553 TaxID=1245471 RepID=S6AWC3_METRE|nr:hypothetical protein [Pseudomonas resinovorans]BAN48856.1 hypothetical protein PCA10_31240 [Pseudomonas resinovorans NBRC 106553]
MNIARRQLPSALLACAGFVAVAASGAATALTLFPRRAAQLLVPIAGTLSTDLDDIPLKGVARINSTTFSDPDLGGPPGVILMIDFVAVVGISRKTRTAYFAHGENRVVRELRSSDQLELTFPITPLNASATKVALPVQANFQLAFDVGNGVLLSATATLSNPTF